MSIGPLVRGRRPCLVQIHFNGLHRRELPTITFDDASCARMLAASDSGPDRRKNTFRYRVVLVDGVVRASPQANTDDEFSCCHGNLLSYAW